MHTPALLALVIGLIVGVVCQKNKNLHWLEGKRDS